MRSPVCPAPALLRALLAALALMCVLAAWAQADTPVNTVAPLLTGTTWRTYTLAVTLGTWLRARLCLPMAAPLRPGPPRRPPAPLLTRPGRLSTGGPGARSRSPRATRATLSARWTAASNPDGTATARSNTTTAVISPYPPQNTVPPVITGTPQRTFTLAASTGTGTGPNVLISYQWQRYTAASKGWANISGATASFYTLTQADEGAVVRVVVSGTNVDGTVQEASASTALITGLAPGTPTAPVITGSAQRGSTLAAGPREAGWASATPIPTSGSAPPTTARPGPTFKVRTPPPTR